MKKIPILLIALMVISVGFLSGCIDVPEELVQLQITSFNVSPNSINIGESANLSWVTIGGSTAEIDNSIGNVSLTGSRIIQPTQTTTYTFTLRNSTKEITATTQIIVNVEEEEDTEEEVPSLSFTKDDTTVSEKLTVVSADPTNLDWGDLTLLINGQDSNGITDGVFGQTGTVSAGDIIVFEPDPGYTVATPTTDYTIAIRYEPTNTLIYEGNFVGN